MSKKSESANVPAVVNTPLSNETAMAEASMFADYAGQGFENTTADDLKIPFLGILQALSPQLEQNTALRAGMLFNTVSNDAFDGKVGVGFIPATTQHLFVEWKPRKEGGGFVGQHLPTSDVVKAAKAASTEFGKYKTPAGNDLIETFYVYGIGITPDGERFQVGLAFKSTNIKKYKAWITKASAIQIQVSVDPPRRIAAPLFAHRYRLVTVAEKNNKGSFYNWEINFDGENAQAARISPKSEDFLAAVDIKKAIDSGTAKIAVESQGGGDIPHEENADGLPVDKSGKAIF